MSTTTAPLTDDSPPDPLRVVVASQNPVKIEAARRGFEQVFPALEIRIESLSVPSGVSDQPFSDDETLKGARTRAENARAARPDADYWIGLEGGLELHQADLMAGAWIFVLGPGGQGRSRTASFLLPALISQKIRQGLELGAAIDEVFNRQGAKRGPGAAGLLTDGVIGRTDLYEPAVVLALIPFHQRRLYPSAD